MFWFDGKFDCGTSASGMPSRFVSTAFAVRGSGRCTSWLKNWVAEPRSYFTPSSSTSVRSTKMIFAWMDTCGVRRSSPFTNSTTSSMREVTSVITSALLVESATTSPRLDRIDFTDGTSDVAFA